MNRQWTGIVGFLVLMLSLTLVAGYYPGVNQGTQGQLAYYPNTGQSVSGENYLTYAQEIDTPQASGAKCDGQDVENASMLGAADTVSAYAASPTGATSTSIVAPAVTTTINDAIVISAYFTVGASVTFTPPGTPTQRASVASTASLYGIWVGDQTKTTAGTVAAQTGTEGSAQNASAATLVFNDGGTHTFTFPNTMSTCQAAAGGTCTLNVPTGTTNGDVMVACVAAFGGTTNNGPTGTLPSNFNLINYGDATTGNSPYCYFRIASSESGSYVVAAKSGTGQSAWLGDWRPGVAIPAANTLVAPTLANWAQSTSYPFGSMIIDSNGNTERAIVGGTSGSGAQPTWTSAVTAWSNTTDNTVTWTMFAIGSAATSSTPNFNTKAVVGQPICVARTGSVFKQMQQAGNNKIPVHTCGTIASIVNNNSITTSFNASSFPTAAEARWGTDDHAALQTWLNSANYLHLPEGACVTTTTLTVPTSTTVNIAGNGSARNWFGYVEGATDGSDMAGVTGVQGSNIWWLTDSLSGVNGGITISAPNAFLQNPATYYWRDLTLWFGAGLDDSGGSGSAGTIPGLYLNDISQIFLQNVTIGNASGDCVYDTATNTSGYANNIYASLQHFLDDYFTGCGGRGFQVNTGPAGAIVQQIDLDSDEIEHNGFEAVKLTGSGYLEGIIFLNTIFQRDDVTATASLYEVNQTLSATLLNACSFEGANYFEADTGSAIIGGITDPLFLCSVAPNRGYQGFSVTTYQANNFLSPPQTLAALPACNAGHEGIIARATTCTNATNGTICSGSSNVHSEVVCNGTNWIQLGG